MGTPILPAEVAVGGVMDCYQRYIMDTALSMKVFAEEDATFVYGEWRAWRQACLAEGRAIPPAEYKKPSAS